MLRTPYYMLLCPFCLSNQFHTVKPIKLCPNLTNITHTNITPKKAGGKELHTAFEILVQLKKTWGVPERN